MTGRAHCQRQVAFLKGVVLSLTYYEGKIPPTTCIIYYHCLSLILHEQVYIL